MAPLTGSRQSSNDPGSVAEASPSLVDQLEERLSDMESGRWLGPSNPVE